MDELHEELEEGGVSRRDALKKMGVTAAGFWAVPVISSFASRAYAAHQSPVCSGHSFTCGGPVEICGESQFGQCFCDDDTEGNSGCFQDGSCATIGVCSSSADCPPGSRCLPTTCCGTPVCVYECGVGDQAAGAQGGQTITGQ
jgi:hypothetical protein